MNSPANTGSGSGSEAAQQSLEVLRSIERKLTALLAITTDQHLRSSQELADPRPRTIDQLLSDAGLSSHEVGKLLGKSRQAVEQRLKRPATPTSPKKQTSNS